MKTAETVKIFLLGMITAFLAVLVFGPGRFPQSIAADGGVAQSGDLMAVSASEDGYLYLIDPVTQHVAVYNNDGGRFMLRGAREYKYDLRIREENRKGGIKVDDAEKIARKSAKED